MFLCPSKKSAVMGDKVWSLDKKKTMEAYEALKPFFLSEGGVGKSDYMIAFLKTAGLWDTLINAQPTLLKKENGKDIRQLNEIVLVKELLGIKHIANTGMMLRDGDLMAMLGFNIEKMTKSDNSLVGIAHKNTLRNHLNRIPTDESYKKWYDQVQFLRKKKWLRGGVYALDGYEIEVSIDDSEYEGAGKVWCPNENRWKYGYKLLLLVNVAEGRERIVGAYLDKIETHETKMFYAMMAHIEQYLCPLEDLMDTLLFDRAYWDEKLLRYLKEEKGIDWVTLGKSNTNLVKEEMKERIQFDPLAFTAYRRKNPRYYERTTTKDIQKKSKEPEYIDLDLGVVRHIDFQPFEQGYLNVVVRRKYPKDQPVYTYYVTTLPIKNPVEIVELYRSRWTIEDDVNRELGQRWALRSLAGRKLNIILARIMIVLKLFNCEKIMEMKKLKEYKLLKEKLRTQENHDFLKGANRIVVYIKNQAIFGTFSAVEFQALVERRLKKELLAKLNLKAGDMISAETLLDFLNRD